MKQPQKRNYQRELEQIIAENVKAGIRPRLLIHSCCAPCSSYVMEYLSEYFDITMYYYNPNIDTAKEYAHRTDELRRLLAEMPLKSEVKLVVGPYEPERFYEIARGHEQDPERGERCHLCYELRLREAARFAAEANQEALEKAQQVELAQLAKQSQSQPERWLQFEAQSQQAEQPRPAFDYFTTSLSISPMKDVEVLNEIGERVAAEYGLRYLPSDFKKKNGYKRSIELSRQYALYRQSYCGCIFSRKNEVDNRG